MMDGALLMQQLFADNLDYQQLEQFSPHQHILARVWD
jgi:hypothetical protein